MGHQLRIVSENPMEDPYGPYVYVDRRFILRLTHLLVAANAARDLGGRFAALSIYGTKGQSSLYATLLGS